MTNILLCKKGGQVIVSTNISHKKEFHTLSSAEVTLKRPLRCTTASSGTSSMTPGKKIKKRHVKGHKITRPFTITNT